MKINLSKNASDRVTIETESFWLVWKVRLLLIFKYKFKRKGRYILGFDEVIYHDHIKNDFVINSGWDVWSGYDWTANNEATDEFLIQFYCRHLKQG